MKYGKRSDNEHVHKYSRLRIVVREIRVYDIILQVEVREYHYTGWQHIANEYQLNKYLKALIVICVSTVTKLL